MSLPSPLLDLLLSPKSEPPSPPPPLDLLCLHSFITKLAERMWNSLLKGKILTEEYLHAVI